MQRFLVSFKTHTFHTLVQSDDVSREPCGMPPVSSATSIANSLATYIFTCLLDLIT